MIRIQLRMLEEKLIYFMFGILGSHWYDFVHFVPLSQIKRKKSPEIKNCSICLKG